MTASPQLWVSAVANMPMQNVIASLPAAGLCEQMRSALSADGEN